MRAMFGDIYRLRGRQDFNLIKNASRLHMLHVRVRSATCIDHADSNAGTVAGIAGFRYVTPPSTPIRWRAQRGAESIVAPDAGLGEHDLKR